MGAPSGPRRTFRHLELTMHGKTIRGAYERIGDSVLVTTVSGQRNVALGGRSDEEAARDALRKLLIGRGDFAVTERAEESRTSDLDKVLEWCRSERLKLIEQRDGLQAGKSRIHEMQDLRWVDVSYQSIERMEKAIADIDRLLAQIDRRSARYGK